MANNILVASLCLLLAVSVAHAASVCSATASLSRIGQWTASQVLYSSYGISVTNTGDCAIELVQLQFSLSGSIITSFSNMTSLDSSSGKYSLSNLGGNLMPGATFSAASITVQVNVTANVAVYVAAQNCSSCSNSAPTSAPTNAPSSAPTSQPTAGPTPAPISQELLLELETAPTELARLSLLTDDQFVFDFQNAVTGVAKGDGGRIVLANPNNFPAVIGHGVAMAIGFIDACGINLPHSHPRATEITFVVSGSFQVGFFSENGARFIGNTLQPGMATIFPRGSIHFQLNLDCEAAIFVAAFNNEDPGVQTTAQSFFGLPVNIVEVALNISSIQTVDDLAAYLPANPALAMQECRQRCGM